MYTPVTTPIFGSLAPTATVDLSLHTFIGVSWHILLPYTLFGGVLMIYSQSRLILGQRSLKRASK
jgi:hypothetical protein